VLADLLQLDEKSLSDLSRRGVIFDAGQAQPATGL
jgi:hypothetical protein